jgi:hypothetical protein
MARHTRPELRERLKAEIQAGDKGGRPGQWSARKSQLLVQAYEREGGGYVGRKDDRQRSLERWGDEDWQHDGDGERYLPKEAWELLTPAQRRATEDLKRRSEDQVAANTDAAKAARAAVELVHLPVAEARKRLSSLDDDTIAFALEAEERGKARKTLIEALSRRRGR